MKFQQSWEDRKKYLFYLFLFLHRRAGKENFTALVLFSLPPREDYGCFPCYP